jgi:hypothetical protein
MAIETRCERTVQGTKMSKVEHDRSTQCAWENQDGSHCQLKKVVGKHMCEVHDMLVG